MKTMTTRSTPRIHLKTWRMPKRISPLTLKNLKRRNLEVVQKKKKRKLRNLPLRRTTL